MASAGRYPHACKGTRHTGAVRAHFSTHSRSIRNGYCPFPACRTDSASFRVAPHRYNPSGTPFPAALRLSTPRHFPMAAMNCEASRSDSWARYRAKPRHATHQLDLESPCRQISLVNIGDFAFAACRRTPAGRDSAGFGCMKIQPGHHLMRFQRTGHFCDRQDPAPAVGFKHGVRLRIARIVPRERPAIAGTAQICSAEIIGISRIPARNSGPRE